MNAAGRIFILWPCFRQQLSPALPDFDFDGMDRAFFVIDGKASFPRGLFVVGVYRESYQLLMGIIRVFTCDLPGLDGDPLGTAIGIQGLSKRRLSRDDISGFVVEVRRAINRIVRLEGHRNFRSVCWQGEFRLRDGHGVALILKDLDLDGLVFCVNRQDGFATFGRRILRTGQMKCRMAVAQFIAWIRDGAPVTVKGGGVIIVDAMEVDATTAACPMEAKRIVSRRQMTFRAELPLFTGKGHKRKQATKP